MLYTLSQSHYDLTELRTLLSRVSDSDAVLLWQNGVLLAVKFPQIFAKIKHVYVLKNDLTARGLACDIPSLDLVELVQLTETYFPQVAW